MEVKQTSFKVWDRQIDDTGSPGSMSLQEFGEFKGYHVKIVVVNTDTLGEQEASISVWVDDVGWTTAFTVLPGNLNIAPLPDEQIAPEAFVEEVGPVRQRLLGAVQVLWGLADE